LKKINKIRKQDYIFVCKTIPCVVNRIRNNTMSVVPAHGFRSCRTGRYRKIPRIVLVESEKRTRQIVPVVRKMMVETDVSSERQIVQADVVVSIVGNVCFFACCIRSVRVFVVQMSASVNIPLQPSPVCYRCTL
jgi:hypothetical protein